MEMTRQRSIERGTATEALPWYGQHKTIRGLNN